MSNTGIEKPITLKALWRTLKKRATEGDIIVHASAEVIEHYRKVLPRSKFIEQENIKFQLELIPFRIDAMGVVPMGDDGQPTDFWKAAPWELVRTHQAGSYRGYIIQLPK